MNREELAWAAGFYDGEGSAGFYLKRTQLRKNTHGQLALTVMQTEPEILERFCRAVGVGKVNGPYVVRNSKYPNRKPQWRYGVQTFEHVQAVIAMLWPWLGETKRVQGLKAISAYHAMRQEVEAA